MVEILIKNVYNMYKYTLKEEQVMKKIAIIPNSTKDIGLQRTQELVRHLNGRAEVYMAEAYADTGFHAVFMRDGLYDAVDAVIVLGGDGTILQAAEPCARRSIPVLGINMGRVGFMAEVEVAEMEKACDRLLAGDYAVQKRMLMKVSIIKNGKKAVSYHALNDVVVSKLNAKMIAVSVYAGEERISAYLADGVILSTPTGSTGYSLSAGGPVADPTMELFIASPICAHMLGARPAVMPADKPIALRLSPDSQADATVMIDGEIREHIKESDEVLVTKSAYTLDLIKMGELSFYDTLIKKLSR